MNDPRRSALKQSNVRLSPLWAAIGCVIAASVRPVDGRATLYLASAGLVLVVAAVESAFAMAYHDELIGLPARRALNDARLRVDGTHMVAMVDVDHFKKFNDTWGHATGDQVLRLVAQCFKGNTKGRDTAARYGGEEFVVVLPQTSVDNAITVADQIRRSVESKKIVKRSTGETLGSITLSLGVAKYIPGEPIAETIDRADACLYAAKRAGRNRVMSEWNPFTLHPKSRVITSPFLIFLTLALPCTNAP